MRAAPQPPLAALSEPHRYQAAILFIYSRVGSASVAAGPAARPAPRARGHARRQPACPPPRAPDPRPAPRGPAQPRQRRRRPPRPQPLRLLSLSAPPPEQPPADSARAQRTSDAAGAHGQQQQRAQQRHARPAAAQVRWATGAAVPVAARGRGPWRHRPRAACPRSWTSSGRIVFKRAGPVFRAACGGVAAWPGVLGRVPALPWPAGPPRAAIPRVGFMMTK